MSYFLRFIINPVIPRKLSSFTFHLSCFSSLFLLLVFFLSLFLEKEDVVSIYGSGVCYGAAVGRLVFSKDNLLKMVKDQSSKQQREEGGGVEDDGHGDMKFILTSDDQLSGDDIRELKVSVLRFLLLCCYCLCCFCHSLASCHLSLAFACFLLASGFSFLLYPCVFFSLFRITSPV
jgi:hypothetical protein